MDQKLIARIICDLEAQADDEQALLKAVLYLMAVLQEPSSYQNPKLYPLSELKDVIHWAMLSLQPVASHFTNTRGVQLSDTVTTKRQLTADGKFRLQAEGLFPDTAPKVRPEFEFDVCISFAGEQRVLAESIAGKLKKDFYLHVFYDDYEKHKFWGHDLFNYLYAVYSRKSRYCVILLSNAYLTKNWTVHELHAAQARVLKERSPYLLPVVVEKGVQPPVEFENVAYLTYEEDQLDQICETINERVWSEKKEYYLVAEEIAEVLNGGFHFNLSFSPFRENIIKSKKPKEQLLVLLIGLLWCSTGMKMKEQLSGLTDYILFAFPPVSGRFNQRDELMLLKPNGKIRRSAHRTADGPLIMQKSFWEPIFEQWRKDYPQMFGDAEEETE